MVSLIQQLEDCNNGGTTPSLLRDLEALASNQLQSAALRFDAPSIVKMSMLSIPSYKTDDPNYRYKMPRLVAKVEGRGNGIRTNITNMGDIARALKRSPDYPTKFCGIELGAQSKFDSNEGKAIVNGSHEQRDLQIIIDRFIDKFVLCQNCNLPEIDLVIKKQLVGYRCNACGHQGESDNAHKLSTFILKNPPYGHESTMGMKKKSKEERHKEKTVKSKKKDDGEESDEKKRSKKEKTSKEKKIKKSSKKKDDDSEEDEDSNLVDQEKSKSKKSKSGVSSPRDGYDENEDQGEEGKKKKIKKNKNKTNEIEELFYDSPEIADVTQNLLNFATETSEDGSLILKSDLSGSSFFDHLRLLQVSQSFNHKIKMFVAFDVLFHPELGGLTSKGLESKMKFIIPVAQGISDSDILTALEDFIMSRINTPVIVDGFKNYPYFVQRLYNADVIYESAILKHYSSKKIGAEGRESYAAAKNAVKPFLDWLQQSNSSDSSDDEEQNHPKIKSLGAIEPVAGVHMHMAASKITDTVTEPDIDDEDLDIDNI